MFWGDCPYDGCDGKLELCFEGAIPDWYPTECPLCKRKVWYRCSRLNPVAWTEEGFNEKFIVNYKSKTIEERLTA